MPRKRLRLRRRASAWMAVCSSFWESQRTIKLPAVTHCQDWIWERLVHELSPGFLPSTLPWQLCIWVANASKTKKVKTWQEPCWQTQRCARLSSKATCSAARPQKSLHWRSKETRLSGIWTSSQMTWQEKVRKLAVLRKWFKLWITTPRYWVWIWPTTDLMSRLGANSATCSIRSAWTRKPWSILNSASITSD